MITDFANGDRIDLRGLGIGDLTTLTPFLSQSGANVVLTSFYGGATETITIQNTTVAALTSAQFIFDTTSDPLVTTGTSGNDLIFGALGNDQLTGGSGNDRLLGGAGADILIGGNGTDTLTGGAGNDIFKYDARGFGADVITDFGTGDRIDLRGLKVGDLASLTPFLSQSGPNVVLSTFFGGATESIVIANTTIAKLTSAQFIFDATASPLIVSGTGGNDVLFGAIGNDQIGGFGGDDRIIGGAGNDRLIGGSGADTLTGGAGADRFVINVGDSLSATRDVVTDFSHAAGDKIDLGRIDPSTDFGDQALSFVSGPFTGIGQVSVAQLGGSSIVSVNLDGNFSTAELVIDVHSATLLNATDFIL